MTKPLFSIVTPVYNSVKYLEETILSVINQTFTNFEYIIIDGGSTDGTLEIIKKYEHKISFWISEKDNGIYDAINKGFELAKGQIYSWLNAGDIYYPGTLKLVALAFEKNIDWVSGIPTIINEDGEFVHVGLPRLYPRKFIKWGLYRGDILGYIQQESTFFKSDLYKANPLNTKLQLAGDYHLWKSFATSSRLITIKTVLASFRIHTNQKSSNLNDYLAECDLRQSFVAKLLRRKALLNKLIKLPTFFIWMK